MYECRKFTKKVSRALIDSVQVITRFIQALSSLCLNIVSTQNRVFSFYLWWCGEGGMNEGFSESYSFKRRFSFPRFLFFLCNQFIYQIITEQETLFQTVNPKKANWCCRWMNCRSAVQRKLIYLEMWIVLFCFDKINEIEQFRSPMVPFSDFASPFKRRNFLPTVHLEGNEKETERD